MTKKKKTRTLEVELLDEVLRKQAGGRRIDGIVIGTLDRVDEAGGPMVSFAGSDGPLAARSLVAVDPGESGKCVALMFEDGDAGRPVLLGVIQEPVRSAADAEVDGERILLEADKEIVLRCGKSSITLTKAGKVIIRGAFLLSRSSGVNRIKGGSVQIN